MTIQEGIQKGQKYLEEQNIDDAGRLARILMQHILQKERSYLICNNTRPLAEQEQKQYEQAIQKLQEGYPFQYITQKQEFMGLPFYVNENVLIPQPDTEILVEEVIKLAQQKEKLKILELCTGSGCIAVSLAKYLKNIEIIATDISPKALEIAKKNSRKNGVEHKIQFKLSDMWQNIEKQTFDIIVSNPPYIETRIIPQLTKQVQKEPWIALDGGEDGLKFYQIISRKAAEYLKKDGFVCLEIGYNQKERVIQLLKQTGKYQTIITKQDLARRDRVVIGGR